MLLLRPSNWKLSPASSACSSAIVFFAQNWFEPITTPKTHPRHLDLAIKIQQKSTRFHARDVLKNCKWYHKKPDKSPKLAKIAEQTIQKNLTTDKPSDRQPLKLGTIPSYACTILHNACYSHQLRILLLRRNATECTCWGPAGRRDSPRILCIEKHAHTCNMYYRNELCRFVRKWKSSWVHGQYLR